MFSSLLPSHNTLAHSWFSFLPDKPCHSPFSGGFQNSRLHIVVFMIPLHAWPNSCALVIFIINLSISFFPVGQLSNKNAIFTVHVFEVNRLSWCRYLSIVMKCFGCLFRVDWFYHPWLFFSSFFGEKCQVGSKREQNLLASHRTPLKTLSSNSESVLTSVQHFCSS